MSGQRLTPGTEGTRIRLVRLLNSLPVSRTRSRAQAVVDKRVRAIARAEIGLLTEDDLSLAESQSQSILHHVEAFAEHSERKGNTIEHTREQIRDLKRVCIQCKFECLNDIRIAAFEIFLGSLKEKGSAPRTIEKYAKLLKQFVTWCVKQKRMLNNPLEGLEMKFGRSIHHKMRRTLTIDLLERLIDVTRMHPLAECGRETIVPKERIPGERKGWKKVPIGFESLQECCDRAKERLHDRPERIQELLHEGLNRSLSFVTMAYTGLRRGELESITVEQVSCNEDSFSIHLFAADAKNRKECHVPVPLFLKEPISIWIKYRRHLADKRGATNIELFDVPRQLVKKLNRDLKVSGIPKVDLFGKSLDVHAFRHTFCTMLFDAGIHPKIMQKLMRHGKTDLTLGTYTHVDEVEVARALERLPLSDFQVSTDCSRLGATSKTNEFCIQFCTRMGHPMAF